MTNQPFNTLPLQPPTRLTWQATLWLVGGVTLLRLLYLVFLCPYELVADEAQYWDWSRRLDICYYSKGPGIAWLIAASTRLLGSTEWTVRLPAVLCGAAAALLTARLAMVLAKGDSRAGFFAAVLFLVTPAYQASSLLMTIDAPLLVCWAAALWATAHIVATMHRWQGKRESASTSHDHATSPAASSTSTTTTLKVLGWWLVLGLAVGAGLLFKYTMLLLLPGMLVFMVLGRLMLRWNHRAIIGAVLAMSVVALCAVPVVVWNHRHHWPTYRHLLGNLELPGGDRVQIPQPNRANAQTPSAEPAQESMWAELLKQPWVKQVANPLEFVGVQMAMVGPGLVLMGLAIRLSWRERWRDSNAWLQKFMVICASGGVLVFYSLIALMHSVEGNWPMAGYVGLIALAGAMLCTELPRYQALVKQWREGTERPRPRMGFLRRKPETLAQVSWHWAVVYGLLTGVGMLLLVPLSELPGVGKVVPVHRFGSSKPLVEMVQRGMKRAKITMEDKPIFMGQWYGQTALLAFYLPGQPVVHSAASYLGDRLSSYDFFADTNLTDPALAGRPALLVTTDSRPWREAFRFTNFRQVEPAPKKAGTQDVGKSTGKPQLKVYAAKEYLGLMPKPETGD